MGKIAMKQYSTKNYITKEEFYRMNKGEELYTGFVIGLGYAFVEYIPIVNLPEDLRRQYFMSSIPVQRIDYSKEAYVRSLNITDEQIKESICKLRSDGTYYVAIDGGHSMIINNLSDVKVVLFDNNGVMSVSIEVLDTRISMSLIDFNDKYKLLASDIVNNFDDANTLIGLGIDIFEDRIWNKNPKLRKKISNDIASSLRRNGYKINASQIKKKYIPRGLKVSSKISGFLGVGLCVGNTVINQEIKASDIYAFSIAVTSIMPGVGWMFGGVFLAADMVSNFITGYTIGEHLDNMIKDEGVLFKWGEINHITLEEMMDKNSDFKFEEKEFIIPRDNTRVEPFLNYY